MNIIEAIKSGKPFRRKPWTHADHFVVDEDNFKYLISGDRTVIGNVNAILAEDWEIQEKLDAAAKHMGCSGSGFEERIRILKENLGF